MYCVISKKETAHKCALVCALSFFAGIRTDEIVANADGLQWTDIDWEDNQILIRAALVKIRRRWDAQIIDNLRAFLEKYRQPKGKIGPSPTTLHRWRLDAVRSTGTYYPSNGARHSFATYYARLHGPHRAADAIGHVGGTTMFQDHYQGRAVQEVEAREYFDIMPL